MFTLNFTKRQTQQIVSQFCDTEKLTTKIFYRYEYDVKKQIT